MNRASLITLFFIANFSINALILYIYFLLVDVSVVHFILPSLEEIKVICLYSLCEQGFPFHKHLNVHVVQILFYVFILYCTLHITGLPYYIVFYQLQWRPIFFIWFETTGLPYVFLYWFLILNKTLGCFICFNSVFQF